MSYYDLFSTAFSRYSAVSAENVTPFLTVAILNWPVVLFDIVALYATPNKMEFARKIFPALPSAKGWSLYFSEGCIRAGGVVIDDNTGLVVDFVEVAITELDATDRLGNRINMQFPKRMYGGRMCYWLRNSLMDALRKVDEINFGPLRTKCFHAPDSSRHTYELSLISCDVKNMSPALQQARASRMCIQRPIMSKEYHSDSFTYH